MKDRYIVEITGYSHLKRFIDTKAPHGFRSIEENAERFNTSEEALRAATRMFEQHDMVLRDSEVIEVRKYNYENPE